MGYMRCLVKCVSGSSGNSDMLLKMNEIREMQERLTLKHFEIDHMRISQEGYLIYHSKLR